MTRKRPLVVKRAPGQAVFSLASGVLEELYDEKKERRSFVEWVDEKRANRLKVDGKVFTWDGFEPLRHVYEAISEHRAVDLIKSAQMGATVLELLANLYRAEVYPGTSHGFYFPTMADVSDLSKIRFRPIARQIGVGQSRPGDNTKDPDTVMAVIHKGSPIYFRYMGGRMSMDSIPLDGVTFDELRLMQDPDVDRVMERISGSPHQWVLCCSTAGYPNCDIDRRFQESQMLRWLSKCHSCGHSFCMALEWPKCVAVSQNDADHEAWYICVKCSKPIDPLQGEWVAEHPKRERPGFHLHQMLARHNTAKKIWTAWSRTRNKAEFYKSKLGIPYIDATAVPLSVAHLRSRCIDRQLRWELGTKRFDSYLGCDQRGGENHVVIIGPHPSRSGELALRHLEVIQHDDPWIRLAELVKLFKVDIGVVDALPNKNESIRFAKAFRGTIFLAYYDSHDPKSADVARWGDVGEKPNIKKMDEVGKYEYTVRVARYAAIGWATDLWLERQCWSPEPEALTQEIKVQGRLERMSVVDSHYANLQNWTLFKHLCSVAREIEKDDETGQIKRARWVNLGLDPHFLHAFTYAAVAYSRKGGRPKILSISHEGELTEEDRPMPPKDLKTELLEQGVPGQGEAELALLQANMTRDMTLVCSKCSQWKQGASIGYCETQGMNVAGDAYACDWFLPKEKG
jgi:hypothetical protein